jgi:uncharacterized protein (DUF2062 family)
VKRVGLRQRLPSEADLRANRALRWLGPLLDRPWLWHLNRRSIAVGLAIGIFFGLSIPFAQGLFAGAAAVVLRANLAVAVLATFVSNPFTTPAILVGAYFVGAHALGEPVIAIREVISNQAWMELLGDIGEPLLAGLLLVATVSSVLTYCCSLLVMRLSTLYRVQRRRARRAGG